jgi:hypothetical protein
MDNKKGKERKVTFEVDQDDDFDMSWKSSSGGSCLWGKRKSQEVEVIVEPRKKRRKVEEEKEGSLDEESEKESQRKPTQILPEGSKRVPEVKTRAMAKRDQRQLRSRVM